jgi:hypothetical protein
VEWYCQGKIEEVVGDKRVPVVLSLSQMTHGLSCDRSCVFCSGKPENIRLKIGTDILMLLFFETTHNRGD